MDSKWKKVRSEGYNYNFNSENGFFARWGKTIDDDPDISPIGPEILDIEVTTSCKGPNGKLCPFCYKANTPNGKVMSLETFKIILDKMPENLTQVAFGADAQAESNPDLFNMMEYCRSKGIVPNITVADITDETADKLAKYCGAVAVSRYADKEVCYNSIKKLTDRGMKQINMHFMISKETLESAYETMEDMKNDSRLANMNAIVLLSLKKKGRGTKGYTPLTQEEFNALVAKAFELGIRFGFDSCGAGKFIEAIKDRPDSKMLIALVEPCESTCFSFYIDVDGKGYPCSFCEGVEGWDDGISIVECEDFLKDVWFNERIVAFREKIISCGRKCFYYNV